MTNDYEKTWQEFWKPLVCDDNGYPDLEQIKKELADYKFLLDNVPKVYDYVTDGKLTKPNYPSEVVISAAADVYSKVLEEERQYWESR